MITAWIAPAVTLVIAVGGVAGYLLRPFISRKVETSRMCAQRQVEACASVYRELLMAARSFRFYLSSNTESTDRAAEDLRGGLATYEECLPANALFLPDDVEAKADWIDKQFLNVWARTGAMRPSNPTHEPGESESQAQTRQDHYSEKMRQLERFHEGGDIANAISQFKKMARSHLTV